MYLYSTYVDGAVSTESSTYLEGAGEFCNVMLGRWITGLINPRYPKIALLIQLLPPWNV